MFDEFNLSLFRVCLGKPQTNNNEIFSVYNLVSTFLETGRENEKFFTKL